MLPPPPKPLTRRENVESITGFEEYQQKGLPYRWYDRTTSDVVSVTGKFPNSLTKEPMPQGWRPCKPYSRFGAIYKPSGFVRGEQIYMGVLEWDQKSIPAGTKPSTTYMYNGINAPFSNDGSHPWMSSNQSTRLITECLLKIQDRKVNYGETLAEARGAISHLADTVTRVVQLFLGIRRRDHRLIAKALGLGKKRSRRHFSSNWLEYQFAWLPLMADIFGTYTLIQEGFNFSDEKPMLLRAVRKLTDSTTIDLSLGGIQANGKVTVEDRCILFYRLNPFILRKYGQLGLINPFEVAWAVVPFSFVVDWFIPIGNLFQALGATIGTEFVDGCLSRTATGTRTLKRLTTTNRYPYQKDKSTYQCVSTHKSFERRAILTPPIPGFYIKNPLSTSHATSALALIAQLSRS